MALRALWTIVIALMVVLAGCRDNSVLGQGAATIMLESNPQKLDAEQVILTREQVDCGVKEDLWDPPVQVSYERTTAKLLVRGRELKFEDDVSVVEPGFRLPYAQMRGKVSLEVKEIVAITPGPDARTKFVEAIVGVKVANKCFEKALPLMGVKRSKFNPEVNPVFQVSYNGESWKVDQLRH